jgi:hypothetical protein
MPRFPFPPAEVYVKLLLDAHLVLAAGSHGSDAAT